MRSVLSYPFFVASLEFVAKESLTVGRTRNPDCERVGVNDTPVFLLNEYIVELNPANFNILNQILN